MKHLIFHLLLWIFMLIVAATFSSCAKAGHQVTDLNPMSNQESRTDALHNDDQEPYCSDYLSTECS